MEKQFMLPDLGEGLTEADVVQWLIAPGDEVALNQTLAEVETAKAVVELPSPYEGVIAALHAEAGATVAVGAPLLTFEITVDEPEGPAAPAAAQDAAEDAATDTLKDAAPQGEQKAQPNLVGYGAAPSAAGRPARRTRRAASTPRPDTAVLEAAPHDAIPATPTEVPPGERPRSTPPVRAHAKALGIEIALVAADVGERRITRDDVDAYAARVGAAAAPASAPTAAVPADLGADGDRAERRIRVRGVRRHTAAAMVQSAFSAPHVTVFHTVDVTATMDLIDALSRDRSLEGRRIGPLTVVAKAVCLALPRTPGLNARWDDDDIVERDYVDLGIAVATERGLVVPNIRDAERMTLLGLADALAELTATARAGKSSPADLAGGTFSLTNIGVFGVEGGTPILPPGQSGILALGAVQKRPWEHRGEIALREVMTLSLSFDHRVVDGAEGARFLKDVADILQEPGRAMLLR